MSLHDTVSRERLHHTFYLRVSWCSVGTVSEGFSKRELAHALPLSATAGDIGYKKYVIKEL